MKIKQPLRIIYDSMIQRCYNKNNDNYHNYGKRGIKVCDRWKSSYENFESDMGKRPESMTLDRIDVNGNYSPDNCKWSSVSEQLENKRPYSNTGYKHVYKKIKNGKVIYRVKIDKLGVDTSRTSLEKAILLVEELKNGN